MENSLVPPRPQTPQALLHRLPDKPADPFDSTHKPSKYIILILGSTDAAGKVQIARSVANALSCPLYQGDSLHESSAKAASVGASRSAPTAAIASTPRIPPEQDELSAQTVEPTSGPNKSRYQRMWLSKLTRTGLLFPEESRPATEGFSGFGGTSSTSTSRRGSASSISSASSSLGPPSSAECSRSEPTNFSHRAVPATSNFMLDTSSALNSVFTLSEQGRRRRANPALMVLTHPALESWHKLAIRSAVGDYGIGVIFVPLYSGSEGSENEEDLPVLRPLDPRTMTSFSVSLGSSTKMAMKSASLGEEVKLRINVNGDVDSKTEEIIQGAREAMDIDQ